MSEQAEKQLFVAVRSMDRRHFISPTDQQPELFELTMPPREGRVNCESVITQLMRADHGMIVNNDLRLATPEDEHDFTAYAMYQRHTVDAAETSKHGIFTPQEVREWQHDMAEMTDDDTLSDNERRLIRVKAHLFEQVVQLFDTSVSRHQR